MKKWIQKKVVVAFAIGLVIGIIATVLYNSGGDEASAEVIVNSDDPSVGFQREPSTRLTEFLIHMDEWVVEETHITSEDFLAEIYKSWPEIDIEILEELRDVEVVREGAVPKIEYHWFKEGQCDMETSNGTYVPVNIVGVNKLAIKLINDGVEDIWISLACLNGMLNIDRASDFSAVAEMEFTIEAGKGLSYYLKDDLASIRVSEIFGLWLFRGKGYHGKRLSPEEARALSTAVVPITVKVKPGWKFRVQGMNNMSIFLPGEGWMTPEEFQRRH